MIFMRTRDSLPDSYHYPLSTIAKVEEEHNGNLKFTRYGETLIVHPLTQSAEQTTTRISPNYSVFNDDGCVWETKPL